MKTFKPPHLHEAKWEDIKRMLQITVKGTYKLKLQCVHAQSLHSCSILCDPMDHSLPGSSLSMGFSP